MYVQGSYASGKCQRKLIFFKVTDCQGNLCCVREKLIFAKMSGKCKGNLQFSFVSNGEKQKMARAVFLTFWKQAKSF